MAEISGTETIFLDAVVYKGDRFLKESILDLTRTFIRVTHQASRKRLHERRSIEASEKNSSQTAFEENISNFAAGLKNRGYPAATVVKHLSEVNSLKF